MDFYICWDMLGDIFVGRVGDTFWSGRDHVCVKFWVAWDVAGSGLGRFSDGFGRVWGKMSEGSTN